MPAWIRVFLVLNVVQDLAIGLSGLLFGDRILLPLADVTPLNARFIAALYLAGGVGIGATALVRTLADARVILAAFGTITGLVLVATLTYWPDFTAGGVPYLWLVTYVVDPIVAALVLFRGLRAAHRGSHRLTPLLLLQGVLFGSLGGLLLAAPGGFLGAWPWVLSPLLARVYGSFFLGFALGAVLAAREARPAAIRPFLAASLALVVLALVASLLHLDRFDGGPAAWLWFGGHGLAVAAFARALALVRLRDPGRALLSPASTQ
jgi:hypothetical protein